MYRLICKSKCFESKECLADFVDADPQILDKQIELRDDDISLKSFRDLETALEYLAKYTTTIVKIENGYRVTQFGVDHIIYVAHGDEVIGICDYRLISTTEINRSLLMEAV